MNQKYGQKRPSDSEIQEALARVLNSTAFGRSERARELLQYLVEQELSGEGARLKGFSIAQDVFGKNAEFDPQTDAVVRVQAGRLRESLAGYYEDEGADDSVRIHIPRGSYVPHYYYAKDAVDDEHDDPDEDASETDESATDVEVVQEIIEPKPSQGVVINPNVPVSSFVVKNIRAIWLALFAIFALLAAILYGVWHLESLERREAAEVISAPEEQIETDKPQSLPSFEFALRAAEDQAIAQEWLSHLTNVASRFHTIRLIDKTAGSGSSTSPEADFQAKLSVRENNTVDVSVVHSEDQSMVWSGNIAFDVSTRNAFNYSTSGALTTLLTPSGRIYSYLADRGELSDLARCLWLTNAYYLRQSSERFVEAFECRDKIINSNFVSALAYADMASLLVERVTDKYDSPSDVTRQQAFDMARKAIESGTVAESYRAFGTALSLFDDNVGREEAYQKAYSLNPFDLEVGASYGWSLLQSGAFAESAAILKNVIESAASERTWWSYSLFVGAFISGDLDSAALAAQKLAGSPRPHYLAARLIMANEKGNEPLREQLLEQFQKSTRQVARDPYAYYSRLYGESAAQTLTEALQAAGYTPPGTGKIAGQ